MLGAEELDLSHEALNLSWKASVYVSVNLVHSDGKNWHEYITEAKKCLVTNGILIIAELQNR